MRVTDLATLPVTTFILRSASPRVEDELDTQIRELNAAGLHDHEIAARTGRSYNTVLRRRQRLGLDLAGRRG
jgi:hypothetical protein